MTRTESRPRAPSLPVAATYRVEGGTMALLAAALFVLAGFDWWWLLACFLIFDLSAAGYAVSNKAGAIGYNLAHSYGAPTFLGVSYLIGLQVGVAAWPLAFLAGCWLFHVGIDRALGYGPRPLIAT